MLPPLDTARTVHFWEQQSQSNRVAIDCGCRIARVKKSCPIAANSIAANWFAATGIVSLGYFARPGYCEPNWVFGTVRVVDTDPTSFLRNR